MRVLVIGGTGWVGHTIANTCEMAGCEVAVCARNPEGNFGPQLSPQIERIQADKHDPQQMVPVLERGWDGIVDSVPTTRAIELIAKQAKGLRRYVHISSTGGYAPLPVVPGDESLPYDHFLGGWASKAEVDELALTLQAEQGFPTTVLRPSYITGPGKRPLDNVGGRREDFIADVIAERELVLPDQGLSLLHPVHVQDLANATLAALNIPETAGEIFNICLAKAVTLTRYLELTAAALNRQPVIRYLPVAEILRQQPEVQERGLRFLATHMCFDIGKAVRLLGYEPHISTEAAIAETARWTARLDGLPIEDR